MGNFKAVVGEPKSKFVLHKLWGRLPVPTTPKKKKAWLAALIIVVVLIGGYGVYYMAFKPKDDLATTQTRIQAANKDAAAKQYDKAIKELKTANSKAATKDGKIIALYSLGTRYSDKGNHVQALRYYQQANREADGNNINAILGIANEAKWTNNAELAKQYYQKAIDFYKVQNTKDNQAIIAALQDELQKISQ